jgi:hypothetical protein
MGRAVWECVQHAKGDGMRRRVSALTVPAMICMFLTTRPLEPSTGPTTMIGA